jgi:hypothetical protein
MTLVFPFPGYRGGLFHSAAALLPWWMALGVVGLDDVIAWIAKRRRHWKPALAQWVFSFGLLLIAALLSLSVAAARPQADNVPRLYPALAAILPDDARVMINDPAALYYYTGLGGVVLPHNAPDVIPEIAQRYDIDYLLLESPDNDLTWAVSPKLLPILDAPPDFLTELDFDIRGVRLYAINH